MSTLDTLRKHDGYKAIYYNYDNNNIGALIFDIEHSVSLLESDNQLRDLCTMRPAVFAWLLAELEIFKGILEKVNMNYDK